MDRSEILDINIRQERIEDYKEVYEVVKKTFEQAEHTDGNEQNLVDALRKGDAFVPELSLVAEEDNKIIGHILFTEVKVGKDTLLGLAPVSVLPGYQKKGIGGKLIEAGHRIAREMGYRGIVLLGYPAYYPKFGYKPSVNFGIKPSFEIPAEFFMAVELEKGSLDGVEGVVQYAKEFGI